MIIKQNKISNGVKIKIEVSARHVHLSQADLEALFGEGYELTKLKDLSQPGQYAAQETVKLVGPVGEIAKARVLGPCREQTQVEISATDAKLLGVDPPVRESGELEATPGLKIIGPKSSINLSSGVILALRHIHMDEKAATELGLKDGDMVKVDVAGDRDLLFERIVVRVDPNFRLAMHIDTDEANAAGINENNNIGEIILSQ